MNPKRPQRSTVGYLILVLAAVAIGMYLMPRKALTDEQLARDIFRGLARGSRGVQEHIDWAHLKALEANIGEMYATLKTDADRQGYRNAFVVGFAHGFRNSGARPGDFANWRVQARDGATVTIATDYPKHKRTLLMVLERSSAGTQRLQEIRWKDEG